MVFAGKLNRDAHRRFIKKRDAERGGFIGYEFQEVISAKSYPLSLMAGISCSSSPGM